MLCRTVTVLTAVRHQTLCLCRTVVDLRPVRDCRVACRTTVGPRTVGIHCRQTVGPGFRATISAIRSTIRYPECGVPRLHLQLYTAAVPYMYVGRRTTPTSARRAAHPPRMAQVAPIEGHSPSAPTGVCIWAGVWGGAPAGSGAEPQPGSGAGSPGEVRGGAPKKVFTRQAPNGRFLFGLDGLVYACGYIDRNLHELRFCCSRCISERRLTYEEPSGSSTVKRL